MNDLELYSINEARRLLGDIARNTIYRLLSSGALKSVVLGRRRFVAATTISQLVANSTTTVSLSMSPARESLTLRRGPRPKRHTPSDLSA